MRHIILMLFMALKHKLKYLAEYLCILFEAALFVCISQAKCVRSSLDTLIIFSHTSDACIHERQLQVDA